MTTLRTWLRTSSIARIGNPPPRAFSTSVATTSVFDLEDVLYQSPAGPITARDVFYGYSKEIEESGQDYFARKTGFTPRSLYRLLREAGFADVFVSVAAEMFNIRAYVQAQHHIGTAATAESLR
jgi:hypothetical protein